MATTDIERRRSAVELSLTDSAAGPSPGSTDDLGRRPFLLALILAAVFHGGLLFAG